MKRKNKNRASVSFLPSLPFLQQSRFTFSFYCLLPPSWLSSKWETIVLGPRPPHVPQFNGWIEERRNKSKNRTSDRLFRVNSFHTSSELLCLPLCKKKNTEWFLEVLTADDGQFEACLLTFCRLLTRGRRRRQIDGCLNSFTLKFSWGCQRMIGKRVEKKSKGAKKKEWNGQEEVSMSEWLYDFSASPSQQRVHERWWSSPDCWNFTSLHSHFDMTMSRIRSIITYNSRSRCFSPPFFTQPSLLSGSVLYCSEKNAGSAAAAKLACFPVTTKCGGMIWHLFHSAALSARKRNNISLHSRTRRRSRASRAAAHVKSWLMALRDFWTCYVFNETITTSPICRWSAAMSSFVGLTGNMILSLSKTRRSQRSRYVAVDNKSQSVSMSVGNSRQRNKKLQHSFDQRERFRTTNRVVKVDRFFAITINCERGRRSSVYELVRNQ